MVKTKEIKEAKLSDLVPDNTNANKHTQYGMHLLEKSISELGLGRSIIVDKNNRIIGGNGVFETASNLGLEECIIVPTDGKKLVVVKREDVDIDSKVGRSLALADNSVAFANLDWDESAVNQLMEEWAVKPEDWGIRLEIGENDPEEEWEGMPGFSGEDKMGAKQIIVHFKTMDDFFRFALLVEQRISEKAKYIWYPEEQKGSQTDHTYEAEKEE